MSKPPVSEQAQVNFRMPVDLRDRLKRASQANNRSMNAEIINRLEDTFFAEDWRSRLQEDAERAHDELAAVQYFRQELVKKAADEILATIVDQLALRKD